MVDVMPGFMDLLPQFAPFFRRQPRRLPVALLVAACLVTAAIITTLALGIRARPAVTAALRRFGVRRPQYEEQRGQAQPGGQAVHASISRMVFGEVSVALQRKAHGR